MVQNATAQVLLGRSRFHHVTPILQELHWLPGVFKAQFQIVVIPYKALYGLDSGYLKECHTLQHLQSL